MLPGSILITFDAELLCRLNASRLDRMLSIRNVSQRRESAIGLLHLSAVQENLNRTSGITKDFYIHRARLASRSSVFFFPRLGFEVLVLFHGRLSVRRQLVVALERPFQDQQSRLELSNPSRSLSFDDLRHALLKGLRAGKKG